MFEKLFKNSYKSKKTISAEEAQDIKNQIQRLEDDNILREAQIVKLNRLVVNDPINDDRYKKRIEIHKRIIADNKQTINELQMKLLDS
tara:strand:- start:77 stop:340 length:264 start_codon:yes stop_codon:yes gene_type:complete